MNRLLSLSVLLVLMSCSTMSEKVVIAHRGASGYLPEHTLESAALAHGFGVDYIEPDLVLTKDNKLVVLHDIHIETTTDVAKKFRKRSRKDGRYYAIDFTLKELKKLNVQERIDPQTGKVVYENRFPHPNHIDFKIPSFEEFIQLVQGLNKSTGKEIGIYPEIKSPEFHTKEGKDITLETFNILKKYGYNTEAANIYVQCFYPPTLKRLKFDLKAKFKLVQLIAENSWNESSANYDFLQTRAGIKEIATYADGIGPYYQQLVKSKDGKKSSDMVRWAHAYGLKVHTYTHRSDDLPEGIKDNHEYFKYFMTDINVDGIFSDFPDEALKYIR